MLNCSSICCLPKNNLNQSNSFSALARCQIIFKMKVAFEVMQTKLCSYHAQEVTRISAWMDENITQWDFKLCCPFWRNANVHFSIFWVVSSVFCSNATKYLSLKSTNPQTFSTKNYVALSSLSHLGIRRSEIQCLFRHPNKNIFLVLLFFYFQTSNN